MLDIEFLSAYDLGRRVRIRQFQIKPQFGTNRNAVLLFGRLNYLILFL